MAYLQRHGGVMASYIDPTVVAKAITPRERQVLAAIRTRGLSLHRIDRDGTAVRITGPGIHITAVTLGTVALADLNPAA